MGYWRKRFGEASSTAGLGLIVSAITAYQTGGTNAVILAAVQAALGCLAVAVPEKGNK
jgi:hypothetical protein